MNFVSFRNSRVLPCDSNITGVTRGACTSYLSEPPEFYPVTVTKRVSLEEHELFTFRISRVLPRDSNITGVTRGTCTAYFSGPPELYPVTVT